MEKVLLGALIDGLTKRGFRVLATQSHFVVLTKGNEVVTLDKSVKSDNGFELVEVKHYG